MDEVSEFTFLNYQRAIKLAPKEFLPAYEWFMDHESVVLPRRPLKQSGLADGIDINLVAGMRGIHKPGGFNFALSVTSTGNSLYQDGAINQGDGTWVLNYRAQAKSNSSLTNADTYNTALRKCLQEGIPVGVFTKVKGTSKYKCMGLAFVESYDSGVFTLHGPVRKDQPTDFWSIVSEEDMSEEIKELLETPNEDDERVFKAVRQAERRGQERFRQELIRAYDGRCAISQCNVLNTLQAAHISSYRGPKSQLVTNGLLLRADFHLLFDSYLMSVDPGDFRVHIAPSIGNSMYGPIEDKQILLPKSASDRPSEQRLAAHFAKFQMENDN